jgi:hypothetical protein
VAVPRINELLRHPSIDAEEAYLEILDPSNLVEVLEPMEQP